MRTGLVVSFVTLTLAQSGCGATTAPGEADAALSDDGPSHCTPGTTFVCACPRDAGDGLQTCRADGVLEECLGCAGAGDAQARDASGTDAWSDAAQASVGVVSCGLAMKETCVLASGEACCILEPGLDHCVAAGSPCACADPGCTATPATCDGPEDCPGGVCCGHFAGGAYTAIACRKSCDGPGQREICHPDGPPCSDPSLACSASGSLPSYLGRCE